ncbi:MAG TPA: GNAT family N-acetyltransferase [Hanamia sp.]|nr:GNAT family N-acetyltransferase [Hanamia sp.]
MLIRKIKGDDDVTMATIIRNSLEEFNAAKPGTAYFDETTDHLSDLFKKKASAYFVMEINNEIAGGAGYFPTKGLPHDTCELVKMYISKKFRGNGYGQMLLQKCMGKAKKRGYQKIYLESMPELVKAILMYEKNGFEYILKPLGNSGHSGCNIWMIKNL